MQPTVYQKPEIRDANDNIIQQGAFGKNTALANATNDGWIDYVANDLEFLYDLAKDEVVPVPSLPASGQTNKTYLLTTTGVSYRWSGTQWVAVSSSEAVGRAETAANLAEQWATKTDGTVDGTEYSAKYYAGLAEASADDAQDVADDMSTHLVQIDKNTGGVSKNSKRISNIEKLLQGNLYDYDTDDDVAYTKTVPSGALPYAGIETLGGKTLVMNQFVKNGNFASTDGLQAYVGTITLQDNVCNYTPTELRDNVYSNSVREKRNEIILGHKYYMASDIKVPHNTQCNLYCAGVYLYHDITADTWTRMRGIAFPISSTNNLFVGVQFRLSPSVYTTSDTIQIRNWFVVDLTLMFGAGNEPTSAEEFQQMFPADYYPYNAGTLLSAGVTGVKSVGVNRLDIMHPWRYGSGFYNISVGSKLSGNSPTITITDNGDGSFSIPIGTGWQGAIYLVPVDDFVTNSYRFKATLTGSNNRTTFYLLDKDYTVLFNSNDTSATQNLNRIVGGVDTNYPTAKYIAIAMGSSTAGTIVVTNPFVAHATVTEYTPYMEATMPIPAEVQALEGYGWSAGILYNYIDFERKVYVKQVGEVVLNGTENWSKTTVAAGVENYVRGFTTIADMLATTDTASHDDTMITTSELLPSCNVETNSGQGDGIHRRSNGTKGLMIGMAGGTDIDVIKTHLANKPLTVHYPLETPIETDISQYLTDNLIEVGAGGTITFPNSNGDDYHIPVPSTETYMIDLQSAIGE